MKTILKVTALLFLVLTCSVFTSCSSDDDEVEFEYREIYGTFKGNVTVTAQDTPGSSFHSYDTDAILILKKYGSDEIYLSVESTTDKVFSSAIVLPAADVKGNKNYEYNYSYDTEYGPNSWVITSPDFDNIKVKESCYMEGGNQLKYEFNGVRIN